MVRKIDSFLRKKGLQTWVEPIVPTGSTFIKPDLIVSHERDVFVMDVSIVVGLRMSESWDLKIEKYGSPPNMQAIENWLHTRAQIHHLPIIVSSRGLLFGPSGRGLRTLGLTTRDICDLCLITIMGSLRTFDFYTRGLKAI